MRTTAFKTSADISASLSVSDKIIGQQDFRFRLVLYPEPAS